MIPEQVVAAVMPRWSNRMWLARKAIAALKAAGAAADMSHDFHCEATIYGAFGITPCNCASRAVQALADVIRREVRLSAGIQEGQEFRCDWVRVAKAALSWNSESDQ